MDKGCPGSEPDWVLRDVTFSIDPGETVAVVGHTGAGQDHAHLPALRFYDVQRGAVRIDGVDVKEMDLADLRSRFGVVLQDPFLFTGTIGGNIRLGTDRIQDAHIAKAAEDVNLGDFVRGLSKGFNEEVRERGSTLSTGQKQLISFARALAHEPKILILDEATSSVDTETEFKVRDALARMVEGRTSLIIAHRLSTVQRADKIIVMHKGQVREMGTHQELLAQRGIYFKLYQLQYKDQELSVARAPAPANADRAGVEVSGRGDDECRFTETAHLRRRPPMGERGHRLEKSLGEGECRSGIRQLPRISRRYDKITEAAEVIAQRVRLHQCDRREIDSRSFLTRSKR